MIDAKQLIEWWIEGLRSGKYKQGKNSLNQKIGSEHFFCSLGVLCEVAIDHGIKIDKWLNEDTGFTSYNGMAHFLSMPLLQIVSDGKLGTFTGDVIEMNDESNKTFPEIADFLEKRLAKDNKG